MLSQQLTIVIPTYNEEKYIWRTLKEINRQFGVKKVKIIIADAKSTDKTVYLINLFKQTYKSNIRIIKGGLTFTHKYVIKMAFDELVNGKYEMISTNPVYKGNLDIRASFMLNLNKYITWFLSKTNPFAIGAFTMVDMQVFNMLGGYDEKALQSEDWLLSKKISTNKFKLIPDLITQDNRRFKRYGYFSMVKLLWRNWKNRNNINYFYEDQGYWN